MTSEGQKRDNKISDGTCIFVWEHLLMKHLAKEHRLKKHLWNICRLKHRSRDG
jgi:hypothetical protein